MPIISKIVPFSGSSLWIWEISEEEERLRMHISEEILRKAEVLTAPGRRKQWLAVRQLLMEAGLMPDIEYDEKGKPFVNRKKISVSHTPEFAGLFLAEPEAGEIGLDVEKIAERIRKISNRFMNDFEKAKYALEDLETLTLIWSAKEALYKKHGGESTFFASRQKVLELDRTLNRITAEVQIGSNTFTEQLGYQIIKDSVLVYTL